MHDREKGADAGARYVRKMYDRFKSWDDAVAAYNAGPARVAYRRKKGIPLPRETRHHLRKIRGEQALAALDSEGAAE
jgi:soluble lytic murein transglycosylase-like protein